MTANQGQVGMVNVSGGLVAESPAASPVLKAHGAALGRRSSKGTPDTPSTQCSIAPNTPDIDNVISLPTLLRSPLLQSHASPALEVCKSPFLSSMTSPALDFCRSPLLGCQACPALEFCRNESDDCKFSPAIELCKSPCLGAQVPPALACHKDSDFIIPVKCPAHNKTEAATPIVDLMLPPSDVNKAKTTKPEFMVDVGFSGAEFQASSRLQRLLQSVKELWKEQGVTFAGDCEEFLSEHKDLKLTILAQGDSLVGFIMYRLHPKKHVAAHMSISRLAVAPDFRRQGYASQLMKWGMRQPGVTFLAVTSLPKALDFYKAFGFRKVETWHTGGTARPDEEPELGTNQVYLEYNPSKNNGGKRQKGRK